MKLRGRAEEPDAAEGAQSLSARGAKQEAHHGPLQRLLDGTCAIPQKIAQALHEFSRRVAGLGSRAVRRSDRLAVLA